MKGDGFGGIFVSDRHDASRKDFLVLLQRRGRCRGHVKLREEV